jgi:hypothetical protein
MTHDALACGRNPVEVWDHAEAGTLDDHERDCPECQTVIDEYLAASEPLRAWRDQPIDVPPALLDRVSATVRATLSGRTSVPIASTLGPVNLDTAVAAAFVRWSIDALPDATARSCRVELTDPHLERPGADPEVAVRVGVVGRLGVVLPDLAVEVRATVRRCAATLLGLDATVVDVTIDDLATEPDGSTAAGWRR